MLFRSFFRGTEFKRVEIIENLELLLLNTKGTPETASLRLLRLKKATKGLGRLEKLVDGRLNKLEEASS